MKYFLFLPLLICLSLPCLAKSQKPPEGFKIISMDSNSVYSQLGLKKNDVITKINGQKVKSVSDMSQVYDVLKKPGRVEIELIRNYKFEKLVYDIK